MTPPSSTTRHSRRGMVLALLAGLILFLLILIVFALKSMIDSRSRALQLASVTSQIQAQLMAEHAASEFQAIDLTLQALLEKIRHGRRPDGRWSDEVRRLIGQRVRFMSQLENIVFLDTVGEAHHAIPRDDGGSGYLWDDLLFTRHRDGLIDFLVTGAATRRGGFRVVFSRRIDGPENDFIGILAGIVDPLFFLSRYQEYRSSDVDAVALYDARGRIVSGFLSAPYGGGERVNRFQRVGEMPLLMTIPNRFLLEGGLRGGETPETVFAIYQLNHFPFHIALAQGKERLLAPARLESRRYVAVIIFASLLVAGLSVLVRHQVVRRRRTETALRKSQERARLMLMLREIALSANQARATHGTLQTCLVQILTYTSWPLGVAWAASPDGGERGEVWLASWREGTDAAPVVEPGAEADLSALSKLRHPVWIPDLSESPHRPDLLFAVEKGMMGGFLVPVMSGDRAVAVLGFFSRRRGERDEELVGIIHQALAPLGQMLERLRAEAALRDREEVYRRMFETNQAVKLLIEPETGAIVDANEAACTFYGYSKSAILEKQITEVNIRPKEKVAEAMAEAMTGERGYFEFVHRLSSGETRHVEVYSGPITIKGRRLLHSIIHDVTERNRLQSQLIKARKMEAVGILSAGIAHDFNNLLSIIIGNVDMAMDDLTPDHPALSLLSEAEGGALRARDLVRKFLLLSGSVGPQKQSLDLEAVIGGVVEAVRNSDRIPPVLDLERNLPPVLGDADQLALALENVFTNADEAMPAGGVVRITASRETGASMPPAVKETPHRSGWVRISIEDQGEGIEGEHLPRIFDAYYSTKDRGSQKGMGLGLAIVQAIIQRHNGHIDVISAPGSGTAFHLYLPATDVSPY